jgi:hypothetical protein
MRRKKPISGHSVGKLRVIYEQFEDTKGGIRIRKSNKEPVACQLSDQKWVFFFAFFNFVCLNKNQIKIKTNWGLD